ncbi:tetratricopeptide repeat protein [Candidatus Moduliflexota bacterium]
MIFSRKGFQNLDAWSLAADLDGIFWDSSVLFPATPFSEARRIHGEALQFLSDGKTDLAAQYWERALEIFPTASTLHRRLADVYRSLGRKKDAARAYSRYLSEHPGAYDLGTVKGELRSLIESSP